jgi:hypothetical protein
MRRAAFIAAMATLAWAGVAGGAPTPTDRPTPQVAIFYYAWYGTLAADGAWEHWGQGGNAPPDAIGSNFYPARGPYSSGRQSIVRAQMREIAGTGIDTVIVSWWGPGSVEDARLPSVVAAAQSAGLHVALHVEPWADRTPQGVADALRGFAALGIRDAYVYDSAASSDADWRAALTGLSGFRVFANTPYAGKALKGGFQGIYTYDVLVYDGSSFARMCQSARQAGLLCAPSVGPGYDSRRATGDPRVRERNDGRWYDHMWQAAVRASADVVSITSYNEWHEGTQIEPARASTGPYASYDGAWGLAGRRAQRAYLDRTTYWVGRLRGALETPLRAGAKSRKSTKTQ